MRIVSGKFRGKTLQGPKHNIRPTLDKVKQALFTRLQFEIQDAVVLDLFSGSGALGIEAVSRGAKRVVFCDNNPQSIALTKKNLNSINHSCEVKVLGCHYQTALEQLRAEKFDLIIVDPPYQSDYYEKVLEFVFENQMLNPNGFIVCERLKDKKIEQNNFALDCSKDYGSVSLDYFVNS